MDRLVRNNHCGVKPLNSGLHSESKLLYHLSPAHWLSRTSQTKLLIQVFQTFLMKLIPQFHLPQFLQSLVSTVSPDISYSFHPWTSHPYPSTYTLNTISSSFLHLSKIMSFLQYLTMESSMIVFLVVLMPFALLVSNFALICCACQRST